MEGNGKDHRKPSFPVLMLESTLIVIVYILDVANCRAAGNLIDSFRRSSRVSSPCNRRHEAASYEAPNSNLACM